MLTQNSTEQNPGLSQSVSVAFGDVWKVTDLSNNTLITTSGRLNTTTLDDTITQVIAGFQNRQADYVFTLHGAIVAILHKDDTHELEP